MNGSKYGQMSIDALSEYENNARIHSEEQIEKIARSIKEFGFVNPVLIDEKNMIIAGHGRVRAAKKLGIKKVPCVRVEGLTETQVRAYILADNKLAEEAEWDNTLVIQELSNLGDFDIEITGFDFKDEADWFSRDSKDYDKREEGNEEYNNFLDKFEEAKTTDDCYTPENIYEVIAEWVAKEYGLNRKTFARPFYPGGDYQKEDYTGKVVVDNPPFSILSEIEEWYNEHGVKYFLFAPHVATFPSKKKCCAICVGVGITYENGARVGTSFVTNMENLAARTAPDLYKLIDEQNRSNTQTRELQTYKYPENVVTASMLCYLSKYGQEFRLGYDESTEKVGALDCQKESSNKIFGGGFIISEKAATRKTEAEKAALDKERVNETQVVEFDLSEREMGIVKELN